MMSLSRILPVHSDYIQAIARAHRYGQTKPCLVFKLMAKDTAEGMRQDGIIIQLLAHPTYRTHHSSREEETGFGSCHRPKDGR